MNYDYYDKYLNKVKEDIGLLCKKKEILRVDLHMHTNYSQDGKQTLREIINNLKDKFDIIAITDHDNIDVYKELYEVIEKGINKPLIIPGVEYTLDNIEYGNQFHIVKLFINPFDKDVINDIKKQDKASYNRSRIQIKRLRENKGLMKLFKDNNIVFGYREYIKYLNDNNLKPEYNTLIKYLVFKIDNKISNIDILNNQIKYNESDSCLKRKELKTKKYNNILSKCIDDKYKNSNRMLLSTLGVREVDDDWFKDYKSSGSISVNSYGQLKIEELNTKYLTVFAHPTYDKLDIVNKIIKNNKIDAFEFNVRNKYDDYNIVNRIIRDNNLLITKGSDNHELNTNLYDDLSFYEVESKEVLKLCR